VVWIQSDCSLPGAVRAGDDCVLHSVLPAGTPWANGHGKQMSALMCTMTVMSIHSTSQLSVNVLATNSANSAPSSALALWNWEAPTGQE
jgi:hypothetical protein